MSSVDSERAGHCTRPRVKPVCNMSRACPTRSSTTSRVGIDGPLPRGGCGGPAAQATRPAGERAWDFAFATGIECSNPLVANPAGGHLRRDLLDECGHYRHFREDLALVKDLGTPCLRYGLPNHLIHL